MAIGGKQLEHSGLHHMASFDWMEHITKVVIQ